MDETKNLDSLQLDGNYPYSQQYSIHNIIIKLIFEFFFKNEDIPYFEFVISLNLDKNTYILGLRIKLTKPHFFLMNFYKHKN
jgi:hypothetical protein